MLITRVEEIREAIIDLKIQNEVKEFSGSERICILQKLQEIFVIGNPRVWWLSLKYKPSTIIFEHNETYKEIVRFFDKEEIVWFVVEEYEQLLYKTNVLNIINIIGNCSVFEYNIVSENYERFLCETDHDNFYYIDINKNYLR